MQIPKLQARAEFMPETYDPEKHTIDVCWTTGAKGLRSGGFFSEPYYEELEVSEQAVRLDRLNNGAPLCDTHNIYSVRAVLGVVERAWVKDGKGYATVRFSQREDVAPIEKDVADGIIRNLSNGYRVHKYAKRHVEGEAYPTLRAVDWEPGEISLVPVGFDAGAQVRSNEQPEFYEVEVIDTRDGKNPIPAVEAAKEKFNKVLDDLGIERQDTTAPPAAESGTTQEETRTMDNENQQPQGGAAATVPNEAQIRAEAQTAERNRISGIFQAVRAAKLGDEMANDLIARGVSVDEARAAVIGKLAEQDAAAPTSSVRVVSDETDNRRAAVESAILLRANPAMEREFKPAEVSAAREFRGVRLIDLARMACETAGISTRGMNQMEIAAAAMNLTRSSQSTSDLPNILANVANKSLRRGYEVAPRTFTAWAREVSAPDFKTMTRAQLGDLPKLEAVNEGGEFKRGTLKDSKETYALATYGKIVAVTRQTIINDDLDALTRIPEGFGRAAADLESDTVYGVLTANAAMADGVALFHNTHKNLGTGGAISLTTLGEARKLMRVMKGPNNTVLNLMPKFLIVPAALETTAEQYLNNVQLFAEQAANVNPFAGKLMPIVEPRLDASSATAWYVAADPAQIDTVEFAYLEGQRGVYIETHEGFEVDGIQIKARLDFAAAAIDHRGMVKNAGS